MGKNNVFSLNGPMQLPRINLMTVGTMTVWVFAVFLFSRLRSGRCGQGLANFNTAEKRTPLSHCSYHLLASQIQETARAYRQKRDSPQNRPERYIAHKDLLELVHTQRVSSCWAYFHQLSQTVVCTQIKHRASLMSIIE